jgi:hypothetical protein
MIRLNESERLIRLKERCRTIALNKRVCRSHCTTTPLDFHMIGLRGGRLWISRENATRTDKALNLWAVFTAKRLF